MRYKEIVNEGTNRIQRRKAIMELMKVKCQCGKTYLLPRHACPFCGKQTRDNITSELIREKEEVLKSIVRDGKFIVECKVCLTNKNYAMYLALIKHIHYTKYMQIINDVRTGRDVKFIFNMLKHAEVESDE